MPSMSQVEALFCRSAPWETATSRWVLPWALQGVQPNGALLEIGGGGGAMAAHILAASPEPQTTTITVTDFDPRMVTAAQDRLRAFGDRAHTRVADATALPFADGQFDMVVSFIMLHHVVDWEQALAEAVRVLKPGGVLVGYDLPNTPPARILHRLEGAPHRFIKPGQLLPELKKLPLTETSVQENVLLAKFRATRTPRPR